MGLIRNDLEFFGSENIKTPKKVLRAKNVLKKLQPKGSLDTRQKLEIERDAEFRHLKCFHNKFTCNVYDRTSVFVNTRNQRHSMVFTWI